jgi:hypothetical protein
MKWRLAFAALGLGAAALLSVLGWWALKRSRSVPLPEAAEVKHLTAELYDLKHQLGQRPVPEFAVPPKYVPLVLSALTPAVPSREQPPHDDVFPALGRLTITTEQGAVTRVELYWGGQNPLYFAVNGVRCFRGGKYLPGRPATEMGVDESVLLAQILDAIYRREIMGEKSEILDDNLRFYLQLFKRATGRDPPAGD